MSPMESTAALAPLQAPATALRAPGAGFWLYVAMGVFCMAVLVAAAAAAILG